jgi:hypothetical protein
LNEKVIAKALDNPHYLGILVKRDTNLLNPESVKMVIGQQKVKDGTKIQWVTSYGHNSGRTKADVERWIRLRHQKMRHHALQKTKKVLFYAG